MNSTQGVQTLHTPLTPEQGQRVLDSQSHLWTCPRLWSAHRASHAAAQLPALTDLRFFLRDEEAEGKTRPSHWAGDQPGEGQHWDVDPGRPRSWATAKPSPRAFLVCKESVDGRDECVWIWILIHMELLVKINGLFTLQVLGRGIMPNNQVYFS